MLFAVFQLFPFTPQTFKNTLCVLHVFLGYGGADTGALGVFRVTHDFVCAFCIDPGEGFVVACVLFYLYLQFACLAEAFALLVVSEGD